MQKKSVAALTAAILITVPTLGMAAMAGANTVNSAAIVDGAVATADLANLAVTNAKIANGAVTDAKISGPISASKIAPGWFQQKYANVVVVAKSGGDFSDPIQAVASITNATANNQILVKVMPGTYDLAGASLLMKSYVTLEGSGAENTTIRSSNVNVDDATCTAGTIIMANNSTLKNLRVVNTAVDAGNNNRVVGVGFNSGTAAAEDIVVQVGTDTTYSQTAGICSYGDATNAILNNVTVEARCGTGPDTGHTAALLLSVDGSATVTNSKLTAFGTDNAHTHVIDCTNGITGSGILNISNSSVEGTLINQLPGGNGNRGIDANSCRANVTNTIVKLAGAMPGTDDMGIGFGSKGGRVISSQVYSSKVAVQFGSSETNTAQVATSLLQGTVPTDQGIVKLVNNFDENFNPIPNQ